MGPSEDIYRPLIDIRDLEDPLEILLLALQVIERGSTPLVFIMGTAKYLHWLWAESEDIAYSESSYSPIQKEAGATRTWSAHLLDDRPLIT
jgi:hypothetical protein